MMNRSMTFFCCLLAMAPVLSPAADLEGRVTRLENILANQRGSDMLLQIQRLQQEVQQLRGQVEQQQYEIKGLKSQLRDQYLDLDARLRGQPGRPDSGTQEPRPTAATQADAERLAPATPEGAATSRPPRDQQRPPDLTPPAAEAPQTYNEQGAYRNAFDLLKQRRYDAAVRAFEDLLARYPKGEFADNARYWLGETHYVKRDYAAALRDFQRVISDYPLSPKVPGAVLKIGYIQDEQKDWPRARGTLQGLVERFPDTTEARLARSRLERMAREGR
jgi:tol-pal system protein YbgF